MIPRPQPGEPEADAHERDVALDGRRDAERRQVPARADRAPRAREPLFADAVEHGVESSVDQRGVVGLVAVDVGRPQFAHEPGMARPGRAPDLAARQLPEHHQGLPHGARRADDEQPLARRHLGVAMQELVRGRPAQDERRGLGRIQRRIDRRDAIGLQDAELRVATRGRQVGDALADPQRLDTRAEADDLPDEVVAEHERRLVLQVGIAPLAQHDVGELNARGQDLHQHFAGPGLGDGGLGHDEPLRAAELLQEQDGLARRRGHRLATDAAEAASGGIDRKRSTRLLALLSIGHRHRPALS